MPDAFFTVPYPEHTHFVGREDDLARLHAALQEEGPVGINPATTGNPTGVTGQGGIGKTQLAVAYAYRYRGEYPDGVLWLNAANEWRVEFARLADDLNLPAAGGSMTLDTADRQRLSRVLAACAALQGGPTARAAYLEVAGLRRFVASLDLNGSTREVANLLVARLELFGFLPDQPTHHALGVLLEYVSGLEDTPAEDGHWLRAIIGRYRLITTATTPQSQDERIIAAFAWLREHPRSLLILDNLAAPATLDEPLTRDCVPGRLPGGVLFTTRRREMGRFRPVELKTLPPGAALRLLLRDHRRQPALDPAHPEHSVAADICATLGYLPLALEIAAAHLAKYSSRPLAAYREELRRRGALDVIADQRVPVITRHETGLAAALAAQWATLGDEAQLLLRVAGQLPEAAYVPVARLGLLAGVPEEGHSFFEVTLTVALDELQDASLIEELAGNQARLHPLVREFARDRTPPEGKDAFRMDCVRRLLDTISDIETLERHVDARGIDALLRDLLAARNLLDRSDQETLLRDLDSYFRVLRQEAHNLRGWQRVDAPGLLAQQLALRLVNSATPALFGDLAAHLRSCGPTWLMRWIARSESLEPGMALSTHKGGVNAVVVVSDGRWAVSGGWDGLRIWNLDTGQSARMWAQQGHRVNAVAVTPDGRRVISGGPEGLHIWNLDTGQSKRLPVEHEGRVNAVAVSPDGRRVISGGTDRTVRVWDLEASHSVGKLAKHAGEVNAVAVIRDGQRAITGTSTGTLYFWNLSINWHRPPLTGHIGRVNAVAATPDGKWAVSGGQDKVIRVWNLDTDENEQTLPGHRNWVSDVAVTSDGRRAVSGGTDGTLRLWDLASGRELAYVVLHNSVRCVAIASGQPPLVVAGDKDGNVYCLEWVE